MKFLEIFREIFSLILIGIWNIILNFSLLKDLLESRFFADKNYECSIKLYFAIGENKVKFVWFLKLQHISLNNRQNILQRKNMDGDTQQLNKVKFVLLAKTEVLDFLIFK